MNDSARSRGDSVRIVDARLDDEVVRSLNEQLQRYYEAVYGGRDDTPVAASEFAPPNGRFAIADVDGAPLGMGGWRRRPDGRAEVKKLFVHPDARRRGVARALMAWLERTARDGGAEWLVLETNELQPDAVALYRALGYVDVDRFGFYADQPTSIYLGRRLSPGTLGDAPLA